MAVAVPHLSAMAFTHLSLHMMRTLPFPLHQEQPLASGGSVASESSNIEQSLVA
jgi:hypothetical protein